MGVTDGNWVSLREGNKGSNNFIYTKTGKKSVTKIRKRRRKVERVGKENTVRISSRSVYRRLDKKSSRPTPLSICSFFQTPNLPTTLGPL